MDLDTLVVLGTASVLTLAFVSILVALTDGQPKDENKDEKKKNS